MQITPIQERIEHIVTNGLGFQTYHLSKRLKKMLEITTERHLIGHLHIMGLATAESDKKQSDRRYCRDRIYLYE